MDEPAIGHVVSELSDLELAVLLSLVCQGHCLVETPTTNVDDVSSELSLICERTFGLSYAVLDCSPHTSLEDFRNGILAVPEKSLGRRNVVSSRDQPRSLVDTAYLDERKVVNVIIAKNFDCVAETIQIQALELIRNGRIYARKQSYTIPRDFLFIPVVRFTEGRADNLFLNSHLNDHFLFCHFHQTDAGYPNLEDEEGWMSEGRESSSSVVRTRQHADQFRFDSHLITEDMISALRLASQVVFISADVGRYLQNIVLFLRLNRAVAGGISARATRQFYTVAKAMAALHGINYLIPSIVSLAARKVYRHRIRVARAEDDRSLQYGSRAESVAMLLKGVDADQIIESVLSEVEAPV